MGGEELIGLGCLFVADDGGEGGVPVGLVVESGVVPSIVGDAEEGDFRHFSLLHGVAEDGEAVFQAFVDRCGVGDSAFVVEVGVHVHREELVGIVVVAGIVPPPCDVAAQVLAHALHVGGIGHTPYAPAGGIDDDVGGRFAEGCEEGFTLFFATTREAAAIDLGNELKGLDGVGGGGAAFVPLFFNGLLKAGDAGGIEVVLRLGGGDGDVVNEHGKLAHAEGVHALVFVHDVGDDGGTIEKVVARMDGPNEVDLGFV